MSDQRASAEAVSGRGLFVPWLVAAALLLVGRFLAAPVAGFVFDDWANVGTAAGYPSAGALALHCLKNMPRPVSVLTTLLGMRLAGDHIAVYSAFALLGSLLTLGLLMGAARELSGSRGGALAAGILFALVPNLTENFFFSTLTLAADALALPLYAAMLWLGIRGMRTGSRRALTGAAACYACAVLAYEVGLFLPAAFLALWPAAGVRTGARRLLPFAIVFLLYAAWRATNAFGLYETWYVATHHHLGLSASGVVWNVKEVVSWWVGDHMLETILNGLQGFGTIAFERRRLFLIGNVLCAVGAVAALRRIDRREGGDAAVPPGWSVTAFCLLGAAGGYVPALLAYVPSRLNYVPAMALCLLAAPFFAARRSCAWRVPAAMAAGLLLCVNQGTAVQWREAGLFNRRLFDHLRATEADWSGRRILLVDSRSLSQQLVARLLQRHGCKENEVASYGNAPLLRGFVLPAMLRLIRPDAPLPEALLDIEYGAHIDGTNLIWHARYDSSQPRTTPTSDVFVVDAWEATADRH